MKSKVIIGAIVALLGGKFAFSSSVTFHYELKSKEYDKCIKINNTNLGLLECDGKDKWEIWYDNTSGQASIQSGKKYWYIINPSAREKSGVWAWVKGLFKTSKPVGDGKPTIGVHEHGPSDFILDKELIDNTFDVTILNSEEEKCLDVEKVEDRYHLVLNKCSDNPSQKWDITRLKTLPYE